VEFPAASGQMGDHFHQADHRQAGRIDDLADACAAQAGSGATKEVDVGMVMAEGFHQTGGVEIS